MDDAPNRKHPPLKRDLNEIRVFPKIGVGPPNHPILIGFSMKFSPSILGW